MATDFEDEGGGIVLAFGETSGGTRVALRINSSGQLELVTAASPVVTSDTGSGAIAATYAPSAAFWLDSVTCHFSATPTTSEDFEITLDANDGSDYDTVLDRVDPSTITNGADLVYKPDDGPLLCESGDAIGITYTNTDGNTYGLRIVARLA